MATITSRALILLGAASMLAACAPSRTTSAFTPLIQAHCPPDATEPRAPARRDSSIRIRNSEVSQVHAKYVTIIIDGFVAAWNTTRILDELNGPPISPEEIKTVEVPKRQNAERRYGVCPGVAILLIETKSGSWRPYAARESR